MIPTFNTKRIIRKLENIQMKAFKNPLFSPQPQAKIAIELLGVRDYDVPVGLSFESNVGISLTFLPYGTPDEDGDYSYPPLHLQEKYIQKIQQLFGLEEMTPVGFHEYVGQLKTHPKYVRQPSNNPFWEAFVNDQRQDFELELYAIDIFPDNPELWTYPQETGSNNIPNWEKTDLKDMTFYPNDRDVLIFFPQDVEPNSTEPNILELEVPEQVPEKTGIQIAEMNLLSPHISGSPLNWNGESLLKEIASVIGISSYRTTPGRAVNSLEYANPVSLQTIQSKLNPYRLMDSDLITYTFDEQDLKKLGIWDPIYNPIVGINSYTAEQLDELNAYSWQLMLLDVSGDYV